MPRTLPSLQTFYYLDHFIEMISFLERNHARLLGLEELAYISDFRRLTHQGQALLVRFINRNGEVFRISALRYPEIDPIESAISELTSIGLMVHPVAKDFQLIALTQNRKELSDAILLANPNFKRLWKLKKPDLLKLALEAAPQLTEKEISDHVIQGRRKTVDYLLFLYFGNIRRGLHTFALRDLGIVKPKGHGAQFKARFGDRNEAFTTYRCSVLDNRISQAEEAELLALVPEVRAWRVENNPRIQDCLDRSSAGLGLALERCGALEEALTVFSICTAHPARERRCRILYSRGEKEPARLLLEEISSDPWSDDELLFAEDFHARKFGKRRLGKLTAMLRESPTILVDEAFRDSAERAATAYFRDTGAIAFRTENLIWRMLVGLLFWEELRASPVQNQFDVRPTDWLDGSFSRKNSAIVEEKIDLVRHGDALPEIERIVEENRGTPNGFFPWSANILDAIRCLFRYANPDGIAKVLEKLISDPRGSANGYPDLMIVEKGKLRFSEIKAEGDQIRRHQLLRMEALRDAGIPVDVTRVKWYVNPLQEYVVVDIETTGGRAGNHRITEVGAVKIRGDKVLATFTTLINPERPIPRHITKLTGICDDMVASAPRFHEIAEDLSSFIGEAIFTAHNASFDYGFIKAEFARMEKNFRCPTLCTVIAMRRYFPGLQSYSLGNLCREFEIPLESHHRALCDATATAELLMKINQKRLAK